MKTLLTLLAVLPLFAQAQTATLTEAEAKARLSAAPERTAATVVSDQGADRAYSPPKEASRSYDLERNLVIVKKTDGSTEKRPLLDLPVLFVKGTAELLDAQSRDNLRTLSNTIRDLESSEQARFIIEGHTSAEGNAAANQTLSLLRARAIQSQLALLLGENAAACLTPQGFGPAHARSPASAPETALQQDRRVLIVRSR
ncbi:MAG: OmpA family protein [Roseimicrobium sp.]